jgi:hypothetical protein
MKAIINKILSVLLAVVVLITTSGFTVFEHHCYTEKTTEYSVLVPNFECDHSEHDHHDNIPSCCEIYSSTQPGEECGKSDCCDTYSFVVKLNIPLDSQDVNKKISIDMFTGLLERDIENTITDSEDQHIIISNDLPPPLAGRDLHIFLHQLNIPYPSV